jgi:exo-beta-1,3-glucanase (GH17 family)
MNTFEKLQIQPGRAICYSGFRPGQYPGGTYPTYDQILEDLRLLQPHWTYLRVYDVDQHTETMLEVIRREALPFKVMLGAYIEAEANNPDCPWGGGVHTEAKLKSNRKLNESKIDRLIEWANTFRDIVFALSVGNEACVDWTDHAVPESRVIEMVRRVKAGAPQPVTFCENYVPWLYTLPNLAREVDFISVHTYPVWEYKPIDESLDYTKDNYYAVANKYPGVPVVITEAGWATQSNGRGIEATNVNETFQTMYFEKLETWTSREGILSFFFEAFDEDWKGSPDPLEPEKHWGVFFIDRSPKMAVQKLYKKLKSNAVR